MTRMLRRRAAAVLVTCAMLLLAVPAATGDSVEALYVEGLRHYVAGDFVSAIESLEAAHAQSPRMDVRIALARAYLKRGQCRELRPLITDVDLGELASEQRRFARAFVVQANERCALPGTESPRPTGVGEPPSKPDPNPATPDAETPPHPSLPDWLKPPTPPKPPAPEPASEREQPAATGMLALVRTIPTGMVSYAGGRFRMGNIRGAADEKPVRRVSVAPFLLDEREVTAGDYAACVASGNCPRDGYVSGRDNPACNIDNPGREGHPANCVSWAAAKAFCASKARRLPTEIEWEYAARGAAGRAHPWGDAAPDCERCGIGGWSCGQGTVPTGTRSAGATPEGVFDLCGNVMEWVADWYAPDAYRTSAKRAPAGPDEGTMRVLRGAVRGRSGWVPTASPDALEATVRSAAPPDSRLPTLGFRCAADGRAK